MGITEMGQGTHTLSRAAARVREARHDLDRLSTVSQGQVAGLRGRWVGAGGEAFFALHRGWTERQAEITRALDELATALTATEKDVTSTDEAVSASYRRVAGRLG
jgi:WXG100 family type VII secretion target